MQDRPGDVARGRVARATLTVRAPAAEVWALLADVRNHVRWIPLTRIDAPAQLAAGSRFVAVSGPFALRGAPGLPDRMIVEELRPPSAAGQLPPRPSAAEAGDAPADDPGNAADPAPRAGVARFRKVGPLLGGWAAVVVDPLDAHRTRITWLEDVHLRGLPPAWTRAALRPVLAAMTRLALRRAAAELAARP